MSIRSLLATVCGVALTAGVAHAAGPTCPAAGDPTPYCGDLPAPIYLSGSTALEPLYIALGPTLINDAASPSTIVYLKSGQGSCTGITAQINNTPIAAGTSANWVDSAGKTCTCKIGTAATPTATADITIGVADVYAQTCGFSAAQLTAANLKDFTGPIGTMTFVVPAASPAKAISFEQAYLLFGFGAQYGVAPWTDPSFLWIRPELSGTKRMIASYIGIGPSKWQGNTGHDKTTATMGCSSGANCADNGSGDVFNGITQTTTTPEKFLGILGMDYILTQAAKDATVLTKVKWLAFRAAGQRYAFYPDSTPTARDKRNVREGRYAIWGPSHLFTKVDGGGNPTALANKVISYLRKSNTDDDTASLTTIVQKANLIPQCAMKVTRDVDGADQRLYTPAAPEALACDCYFEKLAGVNPLPAKCLPANPNMPCNTTDNLCSAGTTCRRGVCESR
jgi:ABC-type phosphate transport system substrate-binding protein